MAVRVRRAEKRDIPAIVEVNCSDVERWYHFTPRGRAEPASYEELSSWERVMHGGPWMDEAALSDYWRRMERLGVIPLVAELEGKVVGHLDVIFCKDPVLGEYFYLDVLMIHRSYRRRGVARALINAAEDLAKDRGFRKLVVQPEDYEGPSGLTYRSLGFRREWEVAVLSLTPKNGAEKNEAKVQSISPDEERPVEAFPMVCGWYVVSAKMWDYAVHPRGTLYTAIPLHSLVFKVLVNSEAFYIHIGEKLFANGVGVLCLWAPQNFTEEGLRRVVGTVEALATAIGLKKLETRTLDMFVEVLGKLGFRREGFTEPFMVKEL